VLPVRADSALPVALASLAQLIARGDFAPQKFCEMAEISKIDVEDRILRRWTPVILRSVLTVSSFVIVVGLGLMLTHSPGFFVERFHAVQAGDVHVHETWTQLVDRAWQGDPHSVMTIGLMILTLVPLARVAFTFFLFLRERELVFVAATAYVLLGLIAGVVLGRIG
jgi:uncharacterized membrane protein